MAPCLHLKAAQRSTCVDEVGDCRQRHLSKQADVSRALHAKLGACSAMGPHSCRPAWKYDPLGRVVALARAVLLQASSSTLVIFGLCGPLCTCACDRIPQTQTISR